MSDTTPTPDQPATDKRRKLNARILTVFGVLIAFFVGIGIGGAGGSDTATVERPEPEVITKTETVTETETVEVEVTPQVCLSALAAAEAMVHEGLVPTLEAAQASYEALAAFDVVAMETALSELESMTPQIEGFVDDYNLTANECRNAS